MERPETETIQTQRPKKAQEPQLFQTLAVHVSPARQQIGEQKKEAFGITLAQGTR